MQIAWSEAAAETEAGTEAEAEREVGGNWKAMGWLNRGGDRVDVGVSDFSGEPGAKIGSSITSIFGHFLAASGQQDSADMSACRIVLVLVRNITVSSI